MSARMKSSLHYPARGRLYAAGNIRPPTCVLAGSRRAATVSRQALEDGNLGQLSRIVADSRAAEDLSWAAQRVSPESFANRGLYVDTPVVLVSGFLLILMLAIAFQRILGLDKFVAELMMKQQDDRRRTNAESRERLERMWNADGKDGRSSSPEDPRAGN